MPFRRRRGGFARRGTREQLIWFRSTTIVIAGPGPLQSQLFNPSAILGQGALDLRMTLRALHVDYSWATGAAFTQANADVVCGILLCGAQEPTADPRMTAATDQNADWLDLWTIPVRRNATDLSINMIPNMTNNHRRIKAMRKVDADEQIAIITTTRRNDTGGNETTGTVTLDIISSALFQRTRR